MRLTHVLIESFRGIGRLELTLDRLTVVIGENNHGKSSLLDVLERCLGRPGAPPPTSFDAADFRRTGAPVPDPIRVVLTFEHHADPSRANHPLSVFDMAMATDDDGERRLRAEFTGRPGSGTMDVRFVDGEGHDIEPRPHDIVLRQACGSSTRSWWCAWLSPTSPSRWSGSGPRTGSPAQKRVTAATRRTSPSTN